MNLYKALGDDENGEYQADLVLSSDSVEELKIYGSRLCADDGVEDAAWIASTESWQELSADGRIYYFIRP